MKIINATPHEITISGIKFPAAPPDKVVRVEVIRESAGNIEVETPTGKGIIPLFRVETGEIINLHKHMYNIEEGGCIIVVSGQAKQKILEEYPEWNYDRVIASPGNLIRDDKGVVIGADGLDL